MVRDRTVNAVQGELAGFNTGKGEKLSNNQPSCLACSAWLLFLSISGVESCDLTLYREKAYSMIEPGCARPTA